MDNNIKWKLKEVGNKRVRIELDQFSKLPTMKEYKEYIKELLGMDRVNQNKELLVDSYSVDLADSILLHRELKEMDSPEYDEVVFSSSSGDILVNTENFYDVFEKLERNKSNDDERKKHEEAIREAVDELWTRG